MSNRHKMLSKHGLTQLLNGWFGWLLFAGRMAMEHEFTHPSGHAFQNSINELLMCGYHRGCILSSINCFVYGRVN
jgi:hypothetical protein